jgi:hypothetical protein
MLPYRAVLRAMPLGRLARRTACGILTALALLGLVLSAGSVPHTHTGDVVGLYNQEHDLSYLAALGGGAPPPVVASATPLDVPVVALAAPAQVWPGSAPRHPARPRAPPAR